MTKASALSRLLPRSWGRTAQATSVTRPEGALVWVHAGPGLARMSSELAAELVRMLDGANVCLTGVSDDPPPRGVTRAEAPMPGLTGAQGFLDAWSPDVVILAGADLPDGIATEAAARDVPLIWVDADPHTTSRRFFGLAGARPIRHEWFRAILAASEDAAARLVRLRVPQSRIETLGRLDGSARPLRCNETDRDDIAKLLATRPVWLAAHLAPGEIAAVSEAYSEARRLSHRLLLVVAPEDSRSGQRFADDLAKRGWEAGLRSAGAEPETGIQVYVADTDDELGLWYRLAPVTFVGGTLTADGPAGSPLEPAALGSAILTGPHFKAHRDAFQRLIAAGAARRVTDGLSLGRAVGELLSPDRAAQMAHRAWDITSSGARVTDRIVALTGEALAERGAG